ncbi:MAG: hypothetical protein WC346_22175 [Methanogenium sp.]|jgi:hypothetical protein
MSTTYVKTKLPLSYLFNKLGVIDFKSPHILNISHLHIKIKSFNVEKKEEVYSEIQDLVVKEPVPFHFILKNEDGESLKTTSHHKSYKDQEWVESFKRLELEKGHLKIDSPMDVVDLSIKDTSCYYANGQLNHNTTTGGNALKFYASVRLDVRRVSVIKKEGKDITGNKTRIKVVKNKVAPPFREVIVDIVFGEGIDSIADIIELASTQELVKKAGGWYTYGVDKFQGDKFKEFLKNNPDVLKDITDKLREKLNDNSLIIPTPIENLPQ